MSAPSALSVFSVSRLGVSPGKGSPVSPAHGGLKEGDFCLSTSRVNPLCAPCSVRNWWSLWWAGLITLLWLFWRTDKTVFYQLQPITSLTHVIQQGQTGPHADVNAKARTALCAAPAESTAQPHCSESSAESLEDKVWSLELLQAGGEVKACSCVKPTPSLSNLLPW